jgi:hypothetical protein
VVLGVVLDDKRGLCASISATFATLLPLLGCLTVFPVAAGFREATYGATLSS